MLVKCPSPGTCHIAAFCLSAEKGVGVDDAIDVYTSSVLNRTRSIWDGALQILLLVKASISCTATRELSSPSSVIPSDPSIFESFSNLTHFP